jgi:hypothetical protein
MRCPFPVRGLRGVLYSPSVRDTYLDTWLERHKSLELVQRDEGTPLLLVFPYLDCRKECGLATWPVKRSCVIARTRSSIVGLQSSSRVKSITFPLQMM